MSVPVAHKVCTVTACRLRGSQRPPAINPAPKRYPIATRTWGLIRLFSKEYFTKKAAPRKRASPPTHAKSFTPRKLSQLIAGRAGVRVVTGGGGIFGCGKGATRGGNGAGSETGTETGVVGWP